MNHPLWNPREHHSSTASLSVPRELSISEPRPLTSNDLFVAWIRRDYQMKVVFSNPSLLMISRFDKDLALTYHKHLLQNELSASPFEDHD